MPLSNKVLRLGSGLLGNASAQYPEYPRLVKHVFDQVGLAADDFLGHRLSIRYPQIPTAANLFWKSPEKRTG